MLSSDKIKAINTIKRLYRAGNTMVTAKVSGVVSSSVSINYTSRYGTPTSLYVQEAFSSRQDADAWAGEFNDLVLELTPDEPATTQKQANRQLIDSRDRYLPKLHELLKYDADTGVFTWRIRPTARIAPGSVAGTPVGNAGHLQIQVKGWRYMAHELAWALHYGAFATSRVHHRNGSSNAISNLYVGKKS